MNPFSLDIGAGSSFQSSAGSESWLSSAFKGGEKTFVNAPAENKTLSYAIYGAAALVLVLLVSKKRKK